MSGSGRRITAAAALAAALVLGGCSSGADRSQPAPEPTAAPTTGPGDADADLPTAEPVPVDDADSQQAALDAATAALTVFARPDADPAQWWSELSPLLSPTAAVAYEDTDPGAVPASAVTGPPRPTPAVSPYLSTVLVPTDAGEYAVLLVREGGGSPWLVERITPVAAADPAAPEAVTPPSDASSPVTAP
jgi:hypothetical protein